MLTNAQYRFIFNSLQDVIFKDARKPGIEIDGDLTWYIFEYFAFRKKENGEEMFNGDLFSDVGVIDRFIENSTGACPVTASDEYINSKSGKKKIKIRKFVAEDGSIFWVNDEAVKLMPPETYTYRGVWPNVYCYDGDGKLRGLMLAINKREEQQL